MPSKNIRAGLRSFTWAGRDGVTQAFDVTDGTATVRPGRRKRETIASATTGFAGVKETPMAGRITAEIIDSRDLALASFDDWDDGTATFVLANGKTYTLEGSLVGDPPELDALEGKATLEFEGEVTEVTFGE